MRLTNITKVVERQGKRVLARAWVRSRKNEVVEGVMVVVMVVGVEGTQVSNFSTV